MSSKLVVARAKSQDSAQEHLRASKESWNKQVSAWIAALNALKPHLISFKRGLNGRGDPKAGLPISSIKDPMPAQIVGYLGNVHSEFNELASIFAKLVDEAGNIMQEQAQYSAHRRKSQPRRPGTSPGRSQIQTAHNHQIDNLIIAEGSNPISRFWSHLSSLLSSDVNKRSRLSMLEMARKLFRNLIELEDKILSKGMDNIPQVLTNYLLVMNNFQVLNTAFKAIAPTKKPEDNEPTETVTTTTPAVKPILPQPVSNTLEPSTEVTVPTQISSENDLDIKDIVSKLRDDDLPSEVLKKNVVFMTTVGLTAQDVRPFFEAFHAERKEPNERKKEVMQDQMHAIYQDLLDQLSKLHKKAVTDSELQKLASNYLTRLFKKYRLQSNLSNASSATRMEAYQFIRNAKIHTNTIMDLLENKDIDFDKLIGQLIELNIILKQMRKPLDLLNLLYEGKYYEHGELTHKEPILDPARRYFTRKFRRNIDSEVVYE